jgi:Protein of unknown function (DUF2505)
MKYQATHVYERSVDEVLAALTTFEAMQPKYEALGHRDVRLVSRDETPDGGVTVVTKRVVPLDVPGFAKKVLKPTNDVTQTDRWGAAGMDGVRHGTFSVEAKGVPVQIGGTLLLTPTATGCTNEIAVTVECKLPLIGGKIADLVGKDTRTAIDHEGAWTAAHLG